MPELTVIKGEGEAREKADERAEEFLAEGKTIVDFLTDPLRPCIVRTSSNKSNILAVNRGSLDGSFFSSFWDQRISAITSAYVIEYMADEPVVLEMPSHYVRPLRNPAEILAQRGACELIYSGGEVKGIKGALLEAGFVIEELTNPGRWGELEAQRKTNLHSRPDIAEFYLGE